MSEPKLGGLWDLIAWRAAETPDECFCLDEAGRELTFASYQAAAERAAAGLASLGVGEDSPVTWILPTRVASLVLMGALSRLSAIQNPVIPIYRHREVGFVTGQTGARLLIVPEEFRGFDYHGMADELAVIDKAKKDMVKAEKDEDDAALLRIEPAP